MFPIALSIRDWQPEDELSAQESKIEHSEEVYMCPACIANTAVMVAGVGSTGGILAVCIAKFRNFFRVNRLVQKAKET
jgi:hypothetical protein